MTGDAGPTRTTSLWGAAPGLIEQLSDALAAIGHASRLVSDAERWLRAARSRPRYDRRVSAVLDGEAQRLADVAASSGLYGDARRTDEMSELLGQVIAGNWPDTEGW